MLTDEQQKLYGDKLRYMHCTLHCYVILSTGSELWWTLFTESIVITYENNLKLNFICDYFICIKV